MILKLNVEMSGEGKTHVVLLHGWGQSTKAFETVSNHLSKSFKVFNLDLPGFGRSEKPPYPYGTKEYAETLKTIIEEYNIIDPIIIGHSFGGRVAIQYASNNHQVKKLVLIDSAGIVHKKALKYYVKIYLFKILKNVFKLPVLKNYRNRVLSKFGSTDYKNADEFMRKTLVKVVNEDLKDELARITCPTLLIWGTNDEVTPIQDAYIMNELLKDSGIVKIEKAGHFSYLENMSLFLSVLDVFFKEDQ